jgi:hypothetical protein
MNKKRNEFIQMVATHVVESLAWPRPRTIIKTLETMQAKPEWSDFNDNYLTMRQSDRLYADVRKAVMAMRCEKFGDELSVIEKRDARKYASQISEKMADIETLLTLNGTTRTQLREAIWKAKDLMSDLEYCTR